MAVSRGSDLRDLATKRAKLRELSEEGRRQIEEGLNLDDLDNLSSTKSEQSKVVQDRVGTQGSNRLQVAKEFGQKMQQELGALCVGIEEGLAQIGYSVSESYNFSGSEKFWAFLGRFHKKSLDRAKVMRIQRLETQDVKQSVNEIVKRGTETIKQLGEIEKEYEKDAESYKNLLTYIIDRLQKAQPKFKQIKTTREELEAQVKNLRLELESGTVSEDERPSKEQEFEDLQRKYQAALLEETELVEIINNAQRAIPEVQKNRDSTHQSIQAIRQMRRGLWEKLKNFKDVLENAMTAVRAQARLERYENIDPAINKTVTLVTEHNIKVAGAAMQVAIERAAKAAISPEESLRLAQEIRSYIDGYMDGLSKLEEEAQKGARVPVPESDSGSDDTGSVDQLGDQL